MTTPTGPAAGVHLPWERVPDSVQAWAARLGDGPPVSVRDLTGGFSPGATALLAWPGASIFVKAVGAALNPESPHMHRREAVISGAFPRRARSRACSRSTTTATGWRWPSRRSTEGRRTIHGCRRSSTRSRWRWPPCTTR